MKCYIVKDLLPNYIDGLNCEETSAELREHLESCADCNAAYKNMTAAVSKPVSLIDEKKPLRAMKAALKKGRILAFIAGSLAAVIAISITAVLFVRSTENNSIESNFSYFPPEHDVGALPVGKYYMNGDTDGLYYEIFGDKTMQLKDGERFSYVVVSYSFIWRGYLSRFIQEPADMPYTFMSGRYIYRDVTSIDEMKGNKEINYFAEMVLHSTSFSIRGDVFIRID